MSSSAFRGPHGDSNRDSPHKDLDPFGSGAFPTGHLPKSERLSLPIDPFLDEIRRTIEANQVTLVVAETGAGKSVRVPQMLAQFGHSVVVTEPRIIAAKSLAARVAYEMNETLGERVGYRTAVYRNDSRNTQLLYCTDGLELVREVMGGTRAHDILVIDEIHEWNSNMEVLLAWVKARLATEPNFRVVIMSATIEKEALARFMETDAVLEIPGRTFPVEVRPAGPSLEGDIIDLVNQGRNVLVFQPGKREIQETIDALSPLSEVAEILPLHSALSLEEQDRVFAHYERPKVVIATNIAQTSITIDDIDAVVDSGMARQVDIVDGIEGLYLAPISLADSEQRRGRAGRTKPGIYIDHCKEPQRNRLSFGIPEILRQRPDQAVLRLLDAGVAIDTLEFFHPLPKDIVERSRKTMWCLGCVDTEGAITPIGRQIARMPCSIEGGRMLVEGQNRGVLGDVIIAVALLEAGAITDSENRRWQSICAEEETSDLLAQQSVYEYIDAALRDAEQSSQRPEDLTRFQKDLFEHYGISEKGFLRARDTIAMIQSRLGFSPEKPPPTDHNRIEIVKSIAAGLAQHAFECTDRKRALYQNGEGRRELSRDSCVSEADWLVGVPFDLNIMTDKGSTILHLVTKATRIKPEWLLEVAPQMLTSAEGKPPQYSLRNDRVMFGEVVLYGDHFVTERFSERSNDPRASEAFLDWICQLMHEESFPKKARHFEGLEDIYNSNREHLTRLARRAKRAGAEVTEPLNYAALKEYFRGKINGATKISELPSIDVLRL